VNPNPNIILIVDDEPRGRELLEALLTPLGYRLEFAADGREAYNQAVKHQPDLILLDVMMPELDGFEVCRRVRATPGIAEVPIVMVTALDDRDSRLAAIQAGADDFLTKPIDRLEVRARVQSVTRLNRYRRLLAERSKFERIAELSPDGYCLIRSTTELTYANPQARRFLELAPDAPLDGQMFRELAQKHYRLEPEDGWAAWPSNAAERSLLYLVRPETKGEAPLWLQVDELALPGGTDRLVRIHNVTGLITRQREVWNFHKILSHKLRTPLNGLSGSLEVLADPNAPLPAAEVAELAKAALDSANRIGQQVHDILKFIQAPALARLGGYADAAVLPAKVEQIRQSLTIRELTTHVPAELARARFGMSGTALDTALMELIENAQKFHPRLTPKITVTLGRHADGRYSLQVADDGLTLSPEQLAHVWTPYFQAEKLFTGEVRGMGLGLAMVASLVWENGGSCRMFNRPDGPGVIVELLLPAA
jgi:DNA-binding response OmpR family regulator/anti-sigma regulatory factor (Ser/Thr protein kinase)